MPSCDCEIASLRLSGQYRDKHLVSYFLIKLTSTLSCILFVDYFLHDRRIPFSWKLHHKIQYQRGKKNPTTTKLKPEILIVSISSVYFDASIEAALQPFFLNVSLSQTCDLSWFFIPL